MKHVVAIFIAGLVCVTPAGAQSGASNKATGPQQQKMAECSSRAKGLKGDAFVRARNECLRDGASTGKADKMRATRQQRKMAQCNAKAKGLKGEAYSKARNECLRS